MFKPTVKSLCTASVLLACVAAPVAARDIYIYKEADGTVWLTDHRAMPDGMTYIGRHGRPTATRSCQGVDEAEMRRRESPYLYWIHHLASQYEIDPDLVRAVVRVESCFDRRAVSRVGAQGLMQLMPQTATTLGVRDPFNGRENLAGGISYLRRMLNEFEGDIRLALAAYNAGPNAVRRYKGVPPYAETQNYIRRILATYETLRSQRLGMREMAEEDPKEEKSR
ncbi:MAG: lytic transglycosylase domain-containing protein [Gammaproteobacteria bacterium]|nr:MAG: lytic transglycosylase domain-containing protein [Gammaproteobacteria bacterium]